MQKIEPSELIFMTDGSFRGCTRIKREVVFSLYIYINIRLLFIYSLFVYYKIFVYSFYIYIYIYIYIYKTNKLVRI